MADSESDNVQNLGWEMGIRIGEFVAVDRDGNIYGGEPVPRNLQKYVRVR